MKHTIDATGKRLGRVATQAATLLLGKNTPDFSRNVLSNNTVEIINASALAVDQKKLAQKTYTRYTQYPGGLRKTPMSKMVQEKGYAEVMRKAVYGMLPNNKMRSKMMHNLIITE